MSSRKQGLRRVAAVAVATLVALPALAAVANATSTFSFDRLQGIDRYATSVATAASYGASANVILASGVPGHYPDALTASYLAGFKKAPIMLTQFAATPANVLARIAAAGATDVWLVGGTGVISAAQEAALEATYTVHRLGGLDRYLTSAAVIGAAGVAASTTHTAVLATGVNFPDALGGGALSYAKGMPMAITDTDALPASTLSALKVAGVSNVIALGGPSVITTAVINALAAQGITLNRRIYGADRAQTSAMLADYMITSQGFSSTAVNVASGYASGGGADALGAAALSGKENRPTLITDSATVVGPGVTAFLTAHANTLLTGHIFGGTGAVSAASATAMTTAARAATDQTAPGAPTITTPAGAVTVNAAAYTFIGTAEAGSTVTLTGGSSVVTGTATGGNYSIVVPLTQNAANSITATATDAAGNTSVASAAVVITEDSIAPTVTAMHAPSAAQAGTVSVVLTISEAASLEGTSALTADSFSYKVSTAAAAVLGDTVAVSGDGLTVTVTFTTAAAVINAEDTLAYSANAAADIEDAAGNNLATFAAASVSNP